MISTRSLAALALTFAPLSLLTVGGGQTVVGEIQRQVVDVHHWLTAPQFLTDFAVSRMAPGPGSLLVTLIGWQVAGFWGAVVATLAIFGPTAVLIYGIANVWARYSGARWQVALEAGLRPVAAGMILGAVLVLMQTLEGGWLARAEALGATAALVFTRMNPILLLLSGAAVFVGLRALGVG